MKRGSANVKLTVVVGVLGVLALLKAFVVKPSYGDTETVQASEPLFKEFKKDDVALIAIDGPGDKKVELTKSADESDKTKSHWNVASEGNARADQNDVNKVLDAIGRMKKGVVQSRNSDNLATYGLDAAKATTVTAFGASGRGGTPLAQFTVGKIEGDWRNVFLKLPNDAAIHKVECQSSEFEPGPDNTWRDKTIFDHGAADKVAEITIVGPKGTIALAREKVMGPKEKKNEPGKPDDAAKKDDAKSDATAKSDEPKKDDATKKDETKPEELEVKETVWNLVSATPSCRAKKWLCDSMAGYVAKLECESFGTATDKPADLGLEPPQYTVLAKLEGETESKKILFVGNKSKDGKYAVKLPDNPQIWWIASWKGDYLTKSVEDLQETPPPKPRDDASKKDDAKKDETKPDDAKPAEGKTDEPKADAPKKDAGAPPASETKPAAPPAGDPAKKPVEGDAKPAEPKPADPATSPPAKPHDGR